MNARKTWLAMVALAAMTTAAASAVNVVDKENVKLNLGGYLQAIGVAEDVPDKVRDEQRLYLFLREARIRIDGSVQKIPFEVMLATGGEDITPNTNAALGLLDFNFDVPVGEAYDVKIGQFHVPYSRERLVDDSTMSFGDRSIENLGFAWNRDYGVALTSTHGNLTGTFAVMTGGGRDIPQRYLPEKLGSPMLVARFGYNDGIDKDVYHVNWRDVAPDRAHKAAYLNFLYIEDSTIGHSTVVNVRATDKNLLVNGNYNPYIGKQPFSRSRIWQAGGDAAWRAPLGKGFINAEGQLDFSHFENDFGNLSIKGGRVQVGYTRGKLEAGVRIAALYLDKKMALTAGVPAPVRIVPDGKPLKEITPSITYRYKPNVAVVADAPYLPDMLVFQENNVGSYVMYEQPDQVTVIKSGRAVRANVQQARLMIQLSF